MQKRLLTEIVRAAEIEVEYVDARIGIADAHEVQSGQRISLSSRTEGIMLAELKVGTKLYAQITRFNHAAAAQRL